MLVCPFCDKPTFPGDIYCGNCGATLSTQAPSPVAHGPTLGGVVMCPVCGHLNEAGSAYCEVDGSVLSPLAPTPAASPSQPTRQASIPPVPPTASVRGSLIMPDNSEILLAQPSRVFGRSDFLKYLSPENSKEVSRAHFTITREGDAFYLQDGGPDPHNSQAWKPSVNGTRLNGIALPPGVKQKLSPNDVIDTAGLGLNLIFRS